MITKIELKIQGRKDLMLMIAALNHLQSQARYDLVHNQTKFGVSRQTSIKYLRDVAIENYKNKPNWSKVEYEAKQILFDKGFTKILNLNEISNSPYWDYYAEKDDKRWLIDVTIDSKKCMVGKVRRILSGFESAILYKKKGWKLVKIDVIEI